MINVLFWNTGITKKNICNNERNQRIKDTILEIIKENNIDIAVFSENLLNLESICNELSGNYKEFSVASTIQNCRVKMIYDSKYKLSLIRDSKYYAIYTMQNALFELLLSGVHFPSGLYANKRDKEIVANQFMLALKEAQDIAGHKKCVVVGDFNVNPFDDMMMLANYFNAIPYANIVQEKRERGVYGSSYQMFYNPMWNFLGDDRVPNSTYYYDAGGALDFYRNIYDQVIFSADIADCLVKGSLKIITATSNNSLVQGDIPDKELFSDHLPIIFSMKEEM